MKRDQEQIKNLWELVHGMNDAASKNVSTMATLTERLFELHDRITLVNEYMSQVTDPSPITLDHVRRILRGES